MIKIGLIGGQVGEYVPGNPYRKWMDNFPKRPEISPKIYAYTENSSKYEGLIKVGYTEREVAQRMGEHYPTKGPDKLQRYKVLLEESSMRNRHSSEIFIVRN